MKIKVGTIANSMQRCGLDYLKSEDKRQEMSSYDQMTSKGRVDLNPAFLAQEPQDSVFWYSSKYCRFNHIDCVDSRTTHTALYIRLVLICFLLCIHLLIVDGFDM